SLAVFLLVLPLAAEAKSKCQGIVFYRDDRMNMCLAKQCCKATKDDFSTTDFTECNSRLMMDFFTCGGGMDVDKLRTCKHKLQGPPPPPYATAPTTTTAAPEPLCPKGEFCMWGPFDFGFCCDEKNEEVWRNDWAAKCPSKMKTVNVTLKEVYEEGTVLRGKSCKDHFCPRGSKCVQGRYLAHCCV
ncbi:hypothetical protein PENTCL1PPCAC_3890, partial [Pristionchus entomophagus]